ncbi:MAG: helix-hairpin-helix domain-containing protein [Candidatus Thorarchaeota archaeon]
MKMDRNRVSAAILTLPLAWVIAFLLFMRPLILTNPIFILSSIIGLLLGLFIGGIIADKLRGRTIFLIFIEAVILVTGMVQWLLPIDFWYSISGLGFLALIVFLFGCALVHFSIFLNRLVSSIHRGQTVGIVTALTLIIAGVISFFWVFPLPTSFAPAITAGLMLLLLLIAFLVQPWKDELQTYMVPGAIRPYAIWWIIYLVAFGLYVWATPNTNRYLLNSLNGAGPVPAELILIGLGGAVLVFTFLPDKFGRKMTFNIGTLLLGMLCIFGGAKFDPIIGLLISDLLAILEAFIIAFMLGVGVWLVWAEIGSVGMKGRRAAFGWAMLGILAALLWGSLITSSTTGTPLLVYPIAASLVLISIFPLTNAREVVWNERVVEDIDVSVDSRQVSQALRDLEVDTPLRRIEGQIETEIVQLAKIRGITKKQAKELRDAGYETPELLARADSDVISQILSISLGKAEQIIVNARLVKSSETKTGRKSKTKRKTK